MPRAGGESLQAVTRKLVRRWTRRAGDLLDPALDTLRRRLGDLPAYRPIPGRPWGDPPAHADDGPRPPSSVTRRRLARRQMGPCLAASLGRPGVCPTVRNGLRYGDGETDSGPALAGTRGGGSGRRWGRAGLRRLPGGASRETWAFDACVGGRKDAATGPATATRRSGPPSWERPGTATAAGRRRPPAGLARGRWEESRPDVLGAPFIV